MNKHNVYQHIAEKLNHMSKSQEKIAKYILDHTNTVPFLTVAKLAKEVDVSEATVVRFAFFLGYSGYPELQKHMQNTVQQQLTTTERLRMSSQVYEGKEQGIFDIFQDDISNIKTTMEKLDIEAFYKAIDILLNGRKIYILANRSAVSLGVFLEYYLNIILGNTSLVGSVENHSEELYNLSEKDVVIGISFARYSFSTVTMFAFAKESGAITLAITDNLTSPLIPHADIFLTASSHIPTFIDSFTAPLSLINALIANVGKERIHQVEERLEGLEEIWDRFGIFYSKDK